MISRTQAARDSVSAYPVQVHISKMQIDNEKLGGL